MATWAHAPEAAVRVLARPRRGAQALRQQLFKWLVSQDEYFFLKILKIELVLLK